jgi:uncharacterized membrane protein
MKRGAFVALLYKDKRIRRKTMTKKIYWIASAVVIMLLGISLFPRYQATHAASPQTHSSKVAIPSTGSSTIPLSQALCSHLIAGLKSYAATFHGQKDLSAHYRLSTATIASLRSNSCVKWSHLSVGKVTRNFTRQASAYNYTSCVPEYYSDGVSIGPLPFIVGNVNVGMCYNGWAAWPYWGPNCYVSTAPWMGNDVTWCGVWNSGNYQTKGMAVAGLVLSIIGACMVATGILAHSIINAILDSILRHVFQ